jgi:hypothetical protein
MDYTPFEKICVPDATAKIIVPTCAQSDVVVHSKLSLSDGIRDPLYPAFRQIKNQVQLVLASWRIALEYGVNPRRHFAYLRKVSAACPSKKLGEFFVRLVYRDEPNTFLPVQHAFASLSYEIANSTDIMFGAW